MLKDLREIRAKDLKEKIEKYNKVSAKLSEVEKSEAEYNNQPKVEPREFTFLEKVFKTREYEDYLKKVQQERKLLKRYQLIKLKEQKADLQKEIDSLDIENLTKQYEKVSLAQNLSDLDLSLDEAKKLLSENGKKFVLDISDKVSIDRPYKKVNDISKYVLVNKFAYAPNNGIIETPKKLDNKEKESIIINGKEYEYEYSKEENEINFTINDEKINKLQENNDEDKYVIIIKLQDLPKDKIKVLSPVHTVIDGDLEIPKESYILCPEEEVNIISNSNHGINVIGYKGDKLNGYARSFISMLGYRIEKLDIWTWVNPLAQEDFVNVTNVLGFNIDLKTINLMGNQNVLLNINKYIGIMNMIKDNNLLDNIKIDDILSNLINKDILQVTPVEIILKSLLAEQYKGLLQLYMKLEENGYVIKKEYKNIINNITMIPAYKKMTNELVFGEDFKENTDNKNFAKFLKDELKSYDNSIKLPYQLVGSVITYLVLENIKNK